MALRTERTSRRKRRASMYELTVFGAVVLDVMERHGLDTQAQLRRRLADCAGVDFSQQRVSSWLYGKASVDKRFPELFATALDLSDRERMEVAEAFAYGQSVPASGAREGA